MAELKSMMPDIVVFPMVLAAHTHGKRIVRFETSSGIVCSPNV
jgi:hypothetical protein